MAKLYYNRVKAGKMTIDEVPEKWRAEVQRMLDEDTNHSDGTAPDLPASQPEPTVPETSGNDEPSADPTPVETVE